MFRKLASLLFEEEEIIVEEEELHMEPQDKQYEIPPLEGLKASEIKTDQKEAKKKEETVSEIDLPLKEEEVKEMKPEKKKEDKKQPKIQRIDVEDPVEKALKEKKKKIVEKKKTQEDVLYEPQEIISPMFGGDDKKQEPIRIQPVEKKKENEESGIISPIYGKVQRPSKDEPKEEILNLDLEEMVQPKGDHKEVQVSLYDYLEELEDEK